MIAYVIILIICIGLLLKVSSWDNKNNTTINNLNNNVYNKPTSYSSCSSSSSSSISEKSTINNKADSSAVHLVNAYNMPLNKKGGKTETVSPIKKHKDPLKWFIVDRAQDRISAAEKLISEELNKYEIEWYREVAFNGLKISDYGYARYDFLILTPKGIHLIEYDGKSSHSTVEQKKRDALKDKFCKNNNIPLTRYNARHYYHLAFEISVLMKKYGIKLKNK
jgi:hypothetical protein